MESILNHYHTLACGEHFGGSRTAAKVLQSGFYWTFKDAHQFVSTCDKCQRMGSISKLDEPPLQPILKVELFDIWGMDFMGPFPLSFSNLYILLAIDYVSKWVEAIPTKTNDAKVVASFLHTHIFTRFGTPRALTTNGGTHFSNKLVDNVLRKYGVATPEPDPTQLEDPNRNHGDAWPKPLTKSVYQIHFILKSFRK